jgi:carboxymethylenebutenolidase
MNEFQRYLAEEIAVDHADGFVSRGEALRRLGLLGLSMTAASSLLAGFAREAAAAPATAPAPAAAEAPAAAPVPTRGITFAGPQSRKLMGAWAPARRTRGGVLVIHENRGLNDDIRSVAGRLAASGYSALAIDLLSEEGGSGSFADPSEAMAALSVVPPSRFVADMKAGVTELRRRLPGKRIGATGSASAAG